MPNKIKQLGNRPLQIEIKVWHAPGGGVMQRTEYLPISHPMHPWNQVKAKGLNPAHYGLEHPLAAEFKDKSHDELVNEIVELRDELDCLLRGVI